MNHYKEVDTIIYSLSPNERAILPFLHLNSIAKIVDSSKLDETSVKRALEFLSNKNLVKISYSSKKIVSIGDNGVLYLKNELPERRLLNALATEKELSFKQAREKANLSDNELSIALGVLKSKALISLSQDKIILNAKEAEISKKFLEEKLLEALPIDFSDIRDEQRLAVENLKKRKDIIRIEETKEMAYEITDLGNEILQSLDKVKEASDMIEYLTPKIIKDESWKGKKFRHYDIKSRVPSLSGGKRQPYYSFLQEVKETLISLGFEEASGPLVEDNFFNSDALFMPQNHPARGIHDLYFVKPQYGDLSKYRNLLKAVKKVHEHGGKTGSEGWKAKFSEKLSSRLILRSQGTAISARILADKPKIPGKYFAIARCFRPDVIDASHLAEFNQMEGIVIDKKVSFKELLGLLQKFAEKLTGSKNCLLYTSPSPRDS